MQPQDAASPEFEIDVGHGRAILQLRPSTFFRWLQVDRLALAVPEVRFPLDITAGMGQFQHQRCEMTSAALSVDEQGLAAFTSARATLLRRVGFDDVELRLLEGSAGLVGGVRLGGFSAELTGRVFAEPEGRHLRLWLAEPSLFGYLARPAPLVAHDLASVLLGAVQGGQDAPDDVDRPVAIGLGQFLLPPLELLGSRVLAPAGWRLPDSSRVRIAETVIESGRVELRYAAANVEMGALSETPLAGLTAREAQERFRAADDAVLRGDLDGAAAAYRRDLIRYPDHAEFLGRRLLAILCSRRNTLREAARQAEELLERWPAFIHAHLALASVAIAQDRPDKAAQQFAAVADLAEASGDDDPAVCAAVSAARLLRERDPARALALYQRAVARRPGHAEAVDALADGLRRAGRWGDLTQLLHARSRLTRDRSSRARLHLELAGVYSDQLGDAQSARRELEEAVRAQPENLPAWDALAVLLAERDEIAEAIRATERLRELFHGKRDSIGEARAHSRIAALYRRAGEPRRAYDACIRALALVPDEPDTIEQTGQIALELEMLEEAALAFERLFENRSADDAQRRAATSELLRIHALRGDLDAARVWLGQVAAEPDPETLVAVAVLEEQSGDLAQAAATLETAAGQLSGRRAAEVESERSRLLLQLGRDDDAHDALERAYMADPSSALAKDAAFRLADRARSSGDGGAEARWLDAFLDHEPDGQEALRFRRAELAFEAGDAALASSLLDGLDRTAIAGAPRLHADVLGALGDAVGQARLLEDLAANAGTPRERAELLAASALARVAAGDVATAIARARAATELDPEPEIVRQAVADTAWHGRAWEDVVAIYRQRVPAVTGSERVEAAHRLGVGLERVGQLKKAFEAYQIAIESADAGSKLLPECWRRLASLCEQLGDYNEAAEAYATAAVDPRLDESTERRAELHTRAAEILYRLLGRADAAIVEAERALALDPGHSAALATLESIAAETGDNAAIVGFLRKEIEAAEGDPEHQLSLARRISALEASVLSPDAARRSDRAVVAGEDPDAVAEADQIRFLLVEVGDLHRTPRRGQPRVRSASPRIVSAARISCSASQA